MSDQIRLGTHDTCPLVQPTETLAVGKHVFRLYPKGESVLATVYVKSASAPVDFEWYDTGAAEEDTPATRVSLLQQFGIAVGQQDRKTVQRIHNHLRLEVTVSGGPAQIGVLITVVEDFPVTVAVEVEVKNDTGNPLPVSVTGLPLPAGAATAAKQDTGNASLASIDTKLTAPIVVTGPLTDAELRATPVPVSGSVSVLNFPATQTVTGPLTDAQLRAAAVPVSLASQPLPTGASTSALQTTGNTTLTTISNKLPATLGQKAMTASLAVVIASDQSAIPVSAAALPLPAGASTSALQTTGNASLASIDAKLTNPLPVSGPLTNAELRATPVPVSGTVAVSNFPATQNVAVVSTIEVEVKNDTGNPLPVSASSLPLPAGASTSALQATGNASLASIDTKLTAPLAVTGPLTDAQLRATAVPVSITTPIEFEIKNDVGNPLPVAVAALPLPAGAATAAKQDTGNASLASIDTKLTAPLAVTGPLTDAQLRATAVPVSAASLPLPAGAATAALQTTGNTSVANIDTKTPALVAGRVPVDGSGVTQPVSAIALPLPAGASTSALQTTGNASLASIDGKLPTVGQKTMAGSQPVVIASDQSPVPVSAASLPLPTGAATAALQTTGNNSLASIDTKLTAPLAVTGPLTDVQLRATAVPVSLASQPLPTGASTSALQTTGNNSLASIDTKLTAPLAVTGPLTDTQLRATAVPVSAASLPLPAGAATAALQTTGNSSVASIDTKTPALVAGRVPVDGSGVTQPVSAIALPLPAGASTSALQTTGNASLASIDAKLPTVGQKTMAGSQPVVIANDQSTIPVLDYSNASGVQGAITVGLTAVAVRVGGANLVGRKTLTAFHNGNQDIFWGYTNLVTTATGTPFFKSQFAAWSAGPATTIFMISGTAGQNVRVTENA